MSDIHVDTVTHRGISYTISICNPNDDWGDKKGKFHISTPLVISTGYYDSFEEAKKATNTAIDAWRNDNPSSINGWVEKIEQCMVWTGYEDCELDKNEVAKILIEFKKAQVA